MEKACKLLQCYDFLNNFLLYNFLRQFFLFQASTPAGSDTHSPMSTAAGRLHNTLFYLTGYTLPLGVKKVICFH